MVFGPALWENPRAMGKDDRNEELVRRIYAQLAKIDKSARQACRDGGIELGTINNIRQGKSKHPSGDTLLGLAKGLETTVGYLTGETDNPAPVNQSLGAVTQESARREDYSPTEGSELMTNEDRWPLHEAVEELPPKALTTALKMLKNLGKLPGEAKPTNPQRRRRT